MNAGPARAAQPRAGTVTRASGTGSAAQKPR
jgi:hypothetical protein